MASVLQLLSPNLSILRVGRRIHPEGPILSTRTNVNNTFVGPGHFEYTTSNTVDSSIEASEPIFVRTSLFWPLGSICHGRRPMRLLHFTCTCRTQLYLTPSDVPAVLIMTSPAVVIAPRSPLWGLPGLPCTSLTLLLQGGPHAIVYARGGA